MFAPSIGDSGVAGECEEFALFLVQGEADECRLSLQRVDVNVDRRGVSYDSGIVGV